MPKDFLVAGLSSDGRRAVLHDGKRLLHLWDFTTRKRLSCYNPRASQRQADEQGPTMHPIRAAREILRLADQRAS